MDQFLAGILKDPATGLAVSRSRLARLIRDGLVSYDGMPTKASTLVQPGATITIQWPTPAPSTLAPIAVPLTILYEDEDLVVIDKQAGLAVHPGAGDTGPTLVQALLAREMPLSSGGQAEAQALGSRPGIVHRLDKDTTGVMVVAKNDSSHAHLAKQFHDKTNLREYVALLTGVLAQEQTTITSWLARDPKNRLRFVSLPSEPVAGQARARFARSHFRRVATYGNRLCLVKVRLDTGRTHQIRVHAASLKAPILGDPLYGSAIQLPKSFSAEAQRHLAGLRRQMLHAAVLGFSHPRSAVWMQFEAPYPDDFREVCRILEVYKQV